MSIGWKYCCWCGDGGINSYSYIVQLENNEERNEEENTDMGSGRKKREEEWPEAEGGLVVILHFEKKKNCYWKSSVSFIISVYVSYFRALWGCSHVVLPCSHSPHNLQVSPFHPTTTTNSCISELSTTNFISFVSVISRLSERSEILGNSRTLTVASEIMEFPICGWVGGCWELAEEWSGPRDKSTIFQPIRTGGIPDPPNLGEFFTRNRQITEFSRGKLRGGERRVRRGGSDWE